MKLETEAAMSPSCFFLYLTLPWTLPCRAHRFNFVHPYMCSGDSILPYADLEKLLFGCHSTAHWQMANEPRAQHQPLLKKSSPSASQSCSLEDACQASPICCSFPGTVSGFHTGCHVPGSISPAYITSAHFLGSLQSKHFRLSLA